MNKFHEHILTEEDAPQITKEMNDFFVERTEKHIDRVKANADYLGEKYLTIKDDLFKQVREHDDSKFADPEIISYIHITWRRKLEKQGVQWHFNDKLNDMTHQATRHHILHNKHHPEYHDPDFHEDSLNKENRDKPAQRMVNGKLMDTVSLSEMVCDWVAMSQETIGTSDAHAWADDNVNVRWKFTDAQVGLIYTFLAILKTKGTVYD